MENRMADPAIPGPSEMKSLQQTLLARRRQMLDEIRIALDSRADGALTGGERGEDSGDNAQADVSADTNIAQLTRDNDEFRDIEAALARITAGTYGACTDCAEPIGLARLTAFPAAQRCLACQQRYEKGHGWKGGASL